jgi:DNA-binding NarL/FixJ family response regulator
MRVVLVGRADARSRLRTGLANTVSVGLDIVGEASTVEVARSFDLEVDAFLVAPADPEDGAPRERAEDDLPVFESLTPREVDVLALLAEGLPNKAIAARLDISDQTVKFHLASVYGKLGASSRTDAVRRAFRRGIITL